MPPERTLEHVKLGPQQIDLCPQIILHRHAGDDGEMRQRLPRGPRADQKGLHPLVQHRSGDRHLDQPFTGAVGQGIGLFGELTATGKRYLLGVLGYGLGAVIGVMTFAVGRLLSN